MRTYYGLDTANDKADDTRQQAAASGVHIGNNVHVGNNVRVGGKPVAKDTSDAH